MQYSYPARRANPLPIALCFGFSIVFVVVTFFSDLQTIHLVLTKSLTITLYYVINLLINMLTIKLTLHFLFQMHPHPQKYPNIQEHMPSLVREKHKVM